MTPHQNPAYSNEFSTVLETNTATVKSLDWVVPFNLFGKNFEKYVLSIGSNNNNVPHKISHPGIIVFGYMYEYGDFGIVKVPMRRGSTQQREVESFYAFTTPTPKQKLGRTSKSFEEFEKWIRIQSSGKYEQNTYNMLYNNCIHFAMDACKFLDVEYPDNWDKMSLWLIVNKQYTAKVAAVGFFGRNIYYKIKKALISPWEIVNFVQKKIVVSTLQDSSK